MFLRSMALRLCLLTSVSVTALANAQPRYADERKTTPLWTRLSSFLTYRRLLPHTLPFLGGWAVRESCRYPMDVLFFVHTSPSHRRHRAAYRDTLLHPRTRTFFNWTMVFFVGDAGADSLTSHWNHLEADTFGDLVIFSFLDTYRNLSAKFVGGMQWVTKYCQNTRYIVKLDDDVLVHPFRLIDYMRLHLQPKSRDLHCFIWDDAVVYRQSESPWYVPEALFRSDHFYTYCSGRSVIMTWSVMRDLCRLSRLVPPYFSDDAYVTGDLALLAGVGHVDMSKYVTWDTEQIYDVLDNRIIFVHLKATFISLATPLWRLAFWDETTSKNRRTASLLNSSVPDFWLEYFNMAGIFKKKNRCIRKAIRV